MIMDYNRVIRDLNGYSFKGLYREVEKRFDVEEITGAEDTRPKERGTFCMYMEGHWFSCHIRQEDRTPEDPVADLDVSTLQNKLLEPVLGIRDPKTDGRIASSVESGAWTNWCGAVSRTARWRLQCIRRPLRSCSQWRMRDF